MPRRRTSGPERPVPVQLPLFAETASLVRIRSDRNEFRYDRLDICPPLAVPSGFAGRNLAPAPPDLFGRVLLVRQWGRIGTEGRRRLCADVAGFLSDPLARTWVLKAAEAERTPVAHCLRRAGSDMPRTPQSEPFRRFRRSAMGSMPSRRVADSASCACRPSGSGTAGFA